MQIVIEIPNKDIPKHQDVFDVRLHFVDGHIVDADGYGAGVVTDFVELPKGHGRILDEKDILDTENNDGGWYDLVDMPEYIAGVKAIIEADTESEE